MIMNRFFTAILLSALSSLFFSQQAFANRPAAEEGHTEQGQAEQAMADTQPMSDTQPISNIQQQAPSSVDIMMRQQSQQTGDVVVLPPKEIQPGETVRIKLLDFPRRGMSMDKVKNEYGQPAAISSSVGKPPITSWTYNDRIVYFEYSTVLHVVAR